MRVDRRFVLVLLAGALIAGVCIYRVQTNRPLDYATQVAAASLATLAPVFEGVDERNQMFRLQTYVGRHRIIVVFYDGELGADQDETLIELTRRADEVDSKDIKVVGVSRVIPQINRPALERLGKLLGPLISDIDGKIHDRWGRSRPDGGTLPGLFLIDRKGFVTYADGKPRPVANLDELWEELQ